jgi:hypothetical protein
MFSKSMLNERAFTKVVQAYSRKASISITQQQKKCTHNIEAHH